MRASRHTYARLHAAVSSARTMSAALEALGVEPHGPSRKYLLARMRKLGVDTSHLPREGARWTRERLAPAVAVSSSMCEVLRELGLPVLGGHHVHLTRRVRELSLDTSHFTREPTPAPVRRRRPVDILRAEGATLRRRLPPSQLRRALIAVGAVEECAGCGLGPRWRGHFLRLEIDHIDGDWRNNERSNLRFLCPNCHAATDTYRRRGRRGRAATTDPRGAEVPS